jgi:hypothetical protein
MKNSLWFDLFSADASTTDAEHAALLERLTQEPTPRRDTGKRISDMTAAEQLQLGRELGTLGHKHDAMRLRLRP